ncbi:enoyl-CoA hydratase/isomerase family protein [Alcaligenaceae bacterium]|nr:enoyl-CoA hydratase/isomerase family protein [Alcaligenaceae bacterium]
MTLKAQAVSIDASGVATLTICNGGPLNIISRQVALDLTALINELASDAAIKVLIIQGTGSKTFIGGADIKQMVDFKPDTARDFITILYELCEAVRLFPVPTIARMDGWCIGVGLELAACCDMRYASTASQFTMPEVKIGIPSVIHGALLSRLMGEGRARWMMLSGNAIDAQTAFTWGLLNGVETSEDLGAKVDELAQEMAECGSVGMRMQKQLLIEWEAPHLQDAVKLSIDRFSKVFESDEPHTHMSEFFRSKKKA